jgi:hypothetical protein
MILPDCSHLWPVAARPSLNAIELIALRRALLPTGDQTAFTAPVAIKILS